MRRWGDNIKMDMKWVVRFSWSCGWGLCFTGIMTPCHRPTSRLDVRLNGDFWKHWAPLIHFLAIVFSTNSTDSQPHYIPATLFFQPIYQCWVICPPHALCHEARGAVIRTNGSWRWGFVSYVLRAGWRIAGGCSGECRICCWETRKV